ncbi:MAG: hypothetical protein ABIU96_00555 [Rhodanobacter sp.]
MDVVASAPGKLVLTGEYAVLEGAPAIVLALDRRARVVLRDNAGTGYVIDAPDLGFHDVSGHLDDQQHFCWSGVSGFDAKRLALVASVLESATLDGVLPGFHAVLDTHALFSSADAKRKLGLGSSAALAVALAGAICARAGRRVPAAERLIAAHRRMQGGRGSGLDIAASLTGGAIVYRLRDEQPQITPVRWPDGLLFACVWSGKAASTGVFLRDLAVWRERAPARYTALLGELALCADAAAEAFAGNMSGALLEAIAAYAAGLERLGAASGLDIVSAEHRVLATIAAGCGVIYKTCGAGGGDIGIALGADAERLRAFRQRVVQAGLQTLDVQLEPHGLQVN